MSVKPASLAALETYWTSQGGIALGVVGNQKHCAGYHLGRDRIYGTCACRPDGTCEPGKRDSDYSVQLSRDRAGLTNAASAIDLGKLGGTYEGLRKFSTWLVEQCIVHARGWDDVREIIYSPDGVTVLRWSGVDGLIHAGPGNGDGSHTTHTHISYFRDSQARDKRPLFAPYFELPDTGTEDPVGVSVVNVLAYTGTATVQGAGHKYIRLWDGAFGDVADGQVEAVIGRGVLGAPVTSPGGSATFPAGTPVALVSVSGQEILSVLLEQDVKLAQSQTDVQHTVTLLKDGSNKLWEGKV